MTFVTRGKRSHIWMIVLITVSIHPNVAGKSSLGNISWKQKLETRLLIRKQKSTWTHHLRPWKHHFELENITFILGTSFPT